MEEEIMVKDVRSPRATGRRPMARVRKRKSSVVKQQEKVRLALPMVSPKTKVKQMQNLMKKMKAASPGMKKAMTGSAKGAGSAGLLAMAKKT